MEEIRILCAAAKQHPGPLSRKLDEIITISLNGYLNDFTI